MLSGASWKRAVVGILFLALALRIVYAVAMPEGRMVQDPALYLGRAMSLFNTGHLTSETVRLVTLSQQAGHQHASAQVISGPDAYWPPLYVLFLAALTWVYSLFGQVGSVHAYAPGLILWLRIVCELLGTLSVGVLGLIALRLFGRRTALWVLLIAAVFPPLIYLPETLYSEALFIPLVLVGVLAMIEHRRSRRHRYVVLAAAMVALASLTRVQAIVLLLPLLIAVWPRRGGAAGLGAGSPGVRAYAPVASLVCVVAVLLAPWAIRNWVKFDHVVPLSLSGGYTLAGVYNAQAATADEIEWVPPRADVHMWRAYFGHAGQQWQQNSALQTIALRYATNHPGYVLRVVYWNVRRLLNIQPLVESEVLPAASPVWLTAIGVWAFWVVAALALIGAFTRAPRAPPKWFWLIPVLMVLSVIAVTVDNERFQISIDPFVVLLAGIGIEWLWWRRPGSRRELRTDDRSGSRSGHRKYRLWRGRQRALRL